MASDATASDVTLVNSYTTGQQITPAITALANGGWVVTWYGEGPGGDGNDIFQRRYAADGHSVGSETIVNSGSQATGYQTDPSITALPDGGWLVAWGSEGVGDFIDIVQQRFAANGDFVPNANRVNSYTTGSQAVSAVTTLSDGSWVVAWQGEGTGDSNGIFQRRYDANGSIEGSETPVNSYTTGDQVDASVTALADGGWVVTWEGEGAGDSAGIFQQHYAANGDQVGTETRVNDYTTNDQLNSSVTALAGGGWVVIWQGEGPGDTAGIFQQRYAANGDTVGSETLVNSYITNDQSAPAITALADGGWVVTWQGEGPGSSQGILQQRYAANGSAVGSETLVNGDGTNPTVTAFATGGWEVTWQGTGAGDSQGIYQRHFAVDIVGTNHGDKLAGTSWGEYLAGRGGNDRLDGKGGDDVLAGGKGDDTYVVNSKGDQVEELTSQGTDTVFASISYTLTGTVENLTLSGKAGLNGTGNAVANKITGNLGANTLKGLAGADHLTGGQGNDKLYGGSESDHFVFRKGDGTDAIKDFDVKGADHDVIDLSHITGISDFADLKAHHMVQVGASVVIDYTAHDSITLGGFKIKDFSAADFQL
jgi:hypothetical protein